MPNDYIEFRVYVKPGTKVQEMVEVAEILHDRITDLVSEDEAPKVFTQDVSYLFHTEE